MRACASHIIFLFEAKKRSASNKSAITCQNKLLQVCCLCALNFKTTLLQPSGILAFK